jgi:LuxR family maltose regulon positive regulatory protein
VILLRLIERMALARLRIAQGDSSQAEAILKNMLRELETSELGQLTMEVRCALSVVLKARGDRESAQKILAKALLDGEPDGFMRCFLNEGARMAALLRSAASSGHSPAYVARLLKAFGQSLSEDATIEPLTERELDVLRLLSEGLTNAAIAEELVVAQSTVKTHINHIYAKLGVTQRTQAVARGRELHLLP